jgi:redox-sensitive bicupin YhaK (pirin superfamily)
MNDSDLVEMIINPRIDDLGHFEVMRALPFKKKRMVGPFIFWDQMGPGSFLTGEGLDVRPHPHIGLSTVTYLFEGSMDHKDSLGNDVRIVPGDVNLMTAGSGIVHSERTGMDIRQHPSILYGIQSWLAQPQGQEDGKAAFEHTDAEKLPVINSHEVKGRVIFGEYEGVVSPVKTQWDTFYVDLYIQPGVQVEFSRLIEERAIYVLSGSIEIKGVEFGAHQMIVLKPGRSVSIKALGAVHLMLLGGATMDGPRFIYWNFVSSSKERLEQAKEDWRLGRFAKIPGDDKEFIPLPDY